MVTRTLNMVVRHLLVFNKVSENIAEIDTTAKENDAKWEKKFEKDFPEYQLLKVLTEKHEKWLLKMDEQKFFEMSEITVLDTDEAEESEDNE